MIYANFANVNFSRKRTVIFLGRVGVGKSQYAGCLCGEVAVGRTGLFDGTTKMVEWTFQHERYSITVYDIEGQTGVLSTDLQRFSRMLEDLGDNDGSKISTVFFCVQWTRLTEVDKEVIAFIKNYMSKDMQKLIHVIVTHAPKNYLAEERSVQELKDQFDFLFEDPTKKEEEFQKKFSFVDLLPPSTQEKFADKCPEAVEVLRGEWNSFRNHMLDVVTTSEHSALTRKAKATAWWQDAITLHGIKMAVVGLVILLFIVCTCYWMLQQSSSQMGAENAHLSKSYEEVQQAYDNMQKDYGFWIGVGERLLKMKRLLLGGIFSTTV